MATDDKRCNIAKVLSATLLIYCIMAYFCHYTPHVADDWFYGSGAGDLFSLFQAQLTEHMTWSGKFIGHFLARVILHSSVWVHALLSPFMFLLLVYSGIILCLGINWTTTIRPWHVIVLAGMLWFTIPAFGTVFLWRTGTPDYGYSLAFNTSFLVPYRFLIDKKNYSFRLPFIYTLYGFVAGCTNENIGMMAIIASSFVYIYVWRSQRVFPPLWALCGIAGAFIGWLFLMTAPGNSLRLDQMGGASKIPLLSISAFNKFIIFWSTQQIEMAPLFITAIIVICFIKKFKNLSAMRLMLTAFIFFAMSQLCLSAFLLSPSTPKRAMSASYFYATLCLFSVFANGISYEKIAKKLYIAFSIILAFSVLQEIKIFWDAQPRLILKKQQKDKNIFDFYSYTYDHTDKIFFPSYDIREIGTELPYWKELIPYGDAKILILENGMKIRALVLSNMIFLADVPQGNHRIAAAASRQDVTGIIQAMMRKLLPLNRQNNISETDINLRYSTADFNVGDDGKAAIHMPGVTRIEDIYAMCFFDNTDRTGWQKSDIIINAN